MGNGAEASEGNRHRDRNKTRCIVLHCNFDCNKTALKAAACSLGARSTMAPKMWPAGVRLTMCVVGLLVVESFALTTTDSAAEARRRGQESLQAKDKEQFIGMFAHKHLFNAGPVSVGLGAGVGVDSVYRMWKGTVGRKPEVRGLSVPVCVVLRPHLHALTRLGVAG